jgi:hypothetical protein
LPDGALHDLHDGALLRDVQGLPKGPGVRSRVRTVLPAVSA